MNDAIASPVVLGARDVLASLRHPAAADALDAVLRSGFDPAAAPARAIGEITGGFFGFMPAQLPASPVGPVFGAKLVTVLPGNRGSEVPVLNGTVALFDGATGASIAFVDAATITELRTPALSAVAYRIVRTRRPAPERILVFGAGPQGIGHLDAFAADGAIDPGRARVSFVVRHPHRAVVPSRYAAADILEAGSAPARIAVRSADLVICATGAAEPLFDSRELPDRTVVIAIGSHTASARELDSALMARARVVVEDPATALREAGDVVLAIEDGRLDPGDLVSLRDLVDDPDLGGSGPVVVKTVGMAWEDVAVAAAALAASRSRDHRSTAG